MATITGRAAILDRMMPVRPLSPRPVVFRRILKNATLVAVLVAAALAVGAAGYHYFNDLPWLDAALDASMILTGMGPVNPIVRPAAKVFAIFYSLFSGVFFLTMVAVLLAPAVHRFLHRFHLELHEKDAKGRRDPD